MAGSLPYCLIIPYGFGVDSPFSEQIGMVSTYSFDPLVNKNELIPIPTTLDLMPSVKQAIVRRIEAGMWIEDKVKEGYNKGSWQHIKQSDKVLIRAWKTKT